MCPNAIVGGLEDKSVDAKGHLNAQVLCLKYQIILILNVLNHSSDSWTSTSLACKVCFYI